MTNCERHGARLFTDTRLDVLCYAWLHRVGENPPTHYTPTPAENRAWRQLCLDATTPNGFLLYATGTHPRECYPLRDVDDFIVFITAYAMTHPGYHPDDIHITTTPPTPSLDDLHIIATTPAGPIAIPRGATLIRHFATNCLTTLPPLHLATNPQWDNVSNTAISALGVVL